MTDPMLPKIGTLPDGRSYVTYPRRQPGRKRTPLDIAIAILVVVVPLIAYALALKYVPAKTWSTTFYHNLSITDPSRSFFYPIWLFIMLIKVRPRRRVLLLWLAAGLGADILIVGHLLWPAIDHFALLGAALLVIAGLFLGDALRWSRLRDFTAWMTNPNIDLGRRIATCLLSLAGLLIVVVALNALLSGQWRDIIRPADWAYLASFAWGWLVSYIVRPISADASVDTVST